MSHFRAGLARRRGYVVPAGATTCCPPARLRAARRSGYVICPAARLRCTSRLGLDDRVGRVCAVPKITNGRESR